MIICFNCSPEIRTTLDSLLKSGQYKDYSEVISFAVMNLAILQEEVLKNGSVVIGADVKLTSPTPIKLVLTESASYTQTASKLHQVSESSTNFAIPTIFLLDNLTNSPPPFAELPDDIWSIRQEIPLDRWIFGQYNKLLPAKASCRALAHLLKNQPKGILLNDATQEIAEEAARLGDFLSYQDERNSISRDDALSTAFPTTNKDSDKSCLRYANQFVASVNKEGQMSGLLFDLKLINRVGRKEFRLLLTEVGWRLATMPNPILDNIQEMPTQKFSEEERNFLLNHIAQSIPVEDFGYRAILTAILEGANTPETIDIALQKYAPKDKERSLSKSFLSSQRSGAISRMTDLGLVARIRDGVRVSYVVTEIGNQYLKTH